jgi:hypothetical protein
MRAARFERDVARATGETVREVRRRGFVPVDLDDVEFDPEPNELPPQIVDWDALADQRISVRSAA